ncbi:MAG: hypothetical protein JWL71_3798 [Acidobacteria bacterium]|nr:hypothetical protein [Acidobacteriota bacterium]
MLSSSRRVWGGHASRPLVIAVLFVHAAALVWLCGDPVRLRLIGYDFHEVDSEASVNAAPDVLRGMGYTEDDPSELQAYRAIAERVVAGGRTEGEKLRRLGNYIYSLRRPDARDFASARLEPLSLIWSGLQRGDHGTCGEMSPVLAAFWRSLGGDVRAVRWATSYGAIGHDAVELYSRVYGKWIYYDMNLNGYGEDDEGTPQSIAALRSHLLTEEDVHLVSDARLRDWDTGQFTAALRAFPVEWYALNNRSLDFEADRRFGSFNRIGWLLGRLPSPLDRVMDNIVGQRDRRMVVEGKIEIADLFTFEGARLFLAWLFVVVLVCTVTLVHPALRRAIATLRASAHSRQPPPDAGVRFRDTDVPRAVTVPEP